MTTFVEIADRYPARGEKHRSVDFPEDIPEVERAIWNNMYNELRSGVLVGVQMRDLGLRGAGEFVDIGCRLLEDLGRL